MFQIISAEDRARGRSQALAGARRCKARGGTGGITHEHGTSEAGEDQASGGREEEVSCQLSTKPCLILLNCGLPEVC